MKLKLDENLGHTAADLFRGAGHNVATEGQTTIRQRPFTKHDMQARNVA